MTDALIIFILIGLLQGILEWLPVSSQAFIFIILILLGFNLVEAYLFSLFIHFGTALAAVKYYWRDYKLVFSNKKLLHFYLIGTIISGGFGFLVFLFYKLFLQSIEDIVLKSSFIILAFIGFLMLTVGFLANKIFYVRGEKSLQDLELRDMILFGVIQGLAAIPGLTRSGVTISYLLFKKMKQSEAVRLSFSIAPLVIIPATLFEILTEQSLLVNFTPLELIAAEIVAFVSSLALIDIMTKIAKRFEFPKFLIIFGILLAVPNLILLLL